MRVPLLVSLLFCALGAGSAIEGHCQIQRVELRVEAGLAAATNGALPFWLHSNESGRFDPLSANGYAQLGLHRVLSRSGWWDAGFGADLVTRGSEASTAYFNQLYGEVRLYFMKFRLGRKIETLGTVDEALSTGSLATSLNATPVPKLVAETTGYTPVPFTRGFAAFKGYFAHGWFGDDRFVENPYLHQKSVYVKLGNPLPVNVFGGIVHDAFWAGTSPEPDFGELPDTFDDYWRIFMGRGGGERAVESERIYVQGNHLGIYDVGITARIKGYELLTYRHFIFDDRDGLKLKNPGDGLFGLSVHNGDRVGWVNRILYEYLYTKRQSGPEPVGDGRDGPGGQDNYYSHYIYRSGWTNYDRSVGNALMLPFPDGEIRVNDRFENNRVVAHHLGIAGNPSSHLRYRLLATYSRNYGTYTERDRANARQEIYRYQDGLRQYSFLIETTLRLSGRDPLEFIAAIALDAGEMFEDNLGLRLGVIYRGSR